MENNYILSTVGFVTIFIGVIIVIISRGEDMINSNPWVFIAYIFSWIIFLITLFIFKQLNMIKLY